MQLGKVEIRPIGRLDDVCPTCGAELSRRPGKKTPCAHCGEFIHVRTRPWDGLRVLASPCDCAEIEAQWEAFSAFKSDLRMIAFDYPVLQPLFDDLHFGRRGQTPIDWNYIEKVVSGAPRGYAAFFPEIQKLTRLHRPE